MKGRAGPLAPEDACTVCKVRKRMNSASQCSACYRSTPTPGHKVTPEMSDTLYALWQDSIERQFRRTSEN